MNFSWRRNSLLDITAAARYFAVVRYWAVSPLRGKGRYEFTRAMPRKFVKAAEEDAPNAGLGSLVRCDRRESNGNQITKKRKVPHMATPYLGEIRMVGFNFAPVGWQLCNGQTLAISQYAALFSLLGTTYGGNGTSTFQLPNLQGRVPVDQGTGQGLSPVVMGEQGGTGTVTLTLANLPMHNHQVNVLGSAGNLAVPSNTSYLAGTTLNPAGTKVDGYSASNPTTTLAPNSLTMAGSGQPVSIYQPYLVVNFIIAMQGIFPSRN
jgi:microcystin-dependent protein